MALEEPLSLIHICQGGLRHFGPDADQAPRHSDVRGAPPQRGRVYRTAGEAVSYTHLDVYKRQILLGIGGILTLKALGIKKDVYHCNEGHAAPVSYTHLDVYKRQTLLSCSRMHSMKSMP